MANVGGRGSTTLSTYSSQPDKRCLRRDNFSPFSPDTAKRVFGVATASSMDCIVPTWHMDMISMRADAPAHRSNMCSMSVLLWRVSDLKR